MTFRLLIIFFSLTPITLLGQTNLDSSSRASTEDIYSIIQAIIKREKLNKNYGILLTPEANCNINKEDSNYLPTLLIKPNQPDTVSKYNSSGFAIMSNLAWPDKNIFTPADIDNILKAKQVFKDYKWDNKRLGFNQNNKKEYYTFSIPYFNLAHDKVVVMYEFLCPGLCGNGKTILLTKTNKGWEITGLEFWDH